MSAFRQALTALFFLAFAGVLTPALTAQDVINNRKPTLEERLQFGLKVRTTDQKKFIKTVVNLVKTGKLKQKVVDESFFWVQKEMEKKKRGEPDARKHIDKFPFFYFKRVIKLNAKRQGVIIK